MADCVLAQVVPLSSFLRLLVLVPAVPSVFVTSSLSLASVGTLP